MGRPTAHADSIAGPSRSGSTRPLVLLAVTDDEVRARFAYQLAAFGFNVLTDISTELRPHRPDIVVADLAGNVSSERGLAGIPVVAVVGDVGANTRALARRGGCAAACLTTCSGAALAAGLRALLDSDER